MRERRSPYREPSPRRVERTPERLCQGCCHGDHVGRCPECGRRCLTWQMQRFVDPQGRRRRVHAALIVLLALAYGTLFATGRIVGGIAALVALIVLVAMYQPRKGY